MLNALNVKFSKQVIFNDCRDKYPLRFDFRIGNLLIEYQGQQHYEPINFGNKDYFQSFENVKRRDEIKRKWCMNNGLILVEIPYTDFDDIPKIIERIIQGAKQY